MKCPETKDEFEELLRLLPLCKETLYHTAQAKIQSGAARTEREAKRQIAEEMGRPFATIDQAIEREKKLHTVYVPCENEKQPICQLHTGDQESYTPSKYIEAARKVMGNIDIDPASNEFAQQTVKATIHYTKEEDGLSKPWNGNIFLNPPYSHPEIKHFIDKLLSELKPEQQAILLTNNNTDTNFFHDAARKAAAMCFTKGRINFVKPDGTFSSPTNGQVFFYFGNNEDKFIEVFSEFGILMGTL